LAGMHSWQAILLGVGLSGLVLTPFMLLIREPNRFEGDRRVAAAGVPVKDVLIFYARHRRALGCHHIGFTLANFPMHAGTVWLPTILVRVEHYTIAQAGFIVGALMLCLGPAGSVVAGMLADRLAKRGRSDGKLIVAIFAAAMFAIANGFIAYHPAPGLFAVGLGGFAFFSSFALPMAPGALQELMPNAMRGQATAAYVGIINIVAGGLAATSVAVLTQYVFHDEAKIGIAFDIVGALAPLLAGLSLQLGKGAFRDVLSSRRGDIRA